MPAGHFLRWRSLGLPFRRKARCLNLTSQVFSVNFKKRVGSKRLKKRGDALVEHMHASHKSRNHGDTSVRNEPPLYCGLHAKTEDDDDDDDEVYLMSSGDEDSSKGMKKWITEYHQNRPGLKVLQGKIDEFILAHETQEEKARIEKEAQAAEGGWTVVVHHKGRKKTTDAESGVAVGSVAQVAVLDKMAKKKKKDLGIDFYGFQKTEAKKNELMMLQSKFEQDKKRIQQLRAARKFRPY